MAWRGPRGASGRVAAASNLRARALVLDKTSGRAPDARRRRRRPKTRARTRTTPTHAESDDRSVEARAWAQRPPRSSPAELKEREGGAGRFARRPVRTSRRTFAIGLSRGQGARDSGRMTSGAHIQKRATPARPFPFRPDLVDTPAVSAIVPRRRLAPSQALSNSTRRHASALAATGWALARLELGSTCSVTTPSSASAYSDRSYVAFALAPMKPMR